MFIKIFYISTNLLGVSGDLALLLHTFREVEGWDNVLNDKGKYVKKTYPEIMKEMNWESIKLKSKEGF